MERKGNTYLLRDNVFLMLTCPNLVISPNEGARIFHSAVSEKPDHRRVFDLGNCRRDYLSVNKTAEPLGLSFYSSK